MRPVGIAKVFGFALALAVFGLATVQAAPVENKAIVRGVRGTANYSTDRGATWKKLNVGATLRQNSVIRTAPGATVDLFLGDNGPVVRVTEDTTMGIDKLTLDRAGDERIIETQLDLRNGRILGSVKKMAAASKYEVKTPTGVAGIRGTRYDISTPGKVTVTEGEVVVVYVVNGVTSTATVTAGQTANPPATPGGNVQISATPINVINDVNRQVNESIQITVPGRQVTTVVTIRPDSSPQDGDPIDSSETEFRSP